MEIQFILNLKMDKLFQEKESSGQKKGMLVLVESTRKEGKGERIDKERRCQVFEGGRTYLLKVFEGGRT